MITSVRELHACWDLPSNISAGSQLSTTDYWKLVWNTCGMPVLLLISVTQFVCGLLYCTLSYCSLYPSHCFLCTRFRFCYSFYGCIFFVPFASTSCLLYFPLSCTLFLLMYICSFLSVYSFTDHCHRVKSQLQLINIIHSFIHSFIHSVIHSFIHSNSWQRRVTEGHFLLGRIGWLVSTVRQLPSKCSS
jgi:hypothetical protein